ncbi:MAG: Flagellar hook-basal body complex protein FliE [Phycisphaerae bacterium]|nr:Flagellar hook-basal body complex protein FliE [Phycisphaerae bacterium]
MSNFIDPIKISGTGGAARPSAAPAVGERAGGADFAATLRQELQRVAAIQNEADAGVQGLLTGRTQNVTEVFATARKAQVAFNVLMEIRNKLADAYTELKQLRV